MSLVNQMLQDLERRQGATLAGDAGVLLDLGSVEEKLPEEPVSRWPLLPVLVVLLVAAVGLWGLQGWRIPTLSFEAARPSAAPSTPIENDAHVEDAAVAPSSTAPAPAAAGDVPVRPRGLRLSTTLSELPARPAAAEAPTGEPPSPPSTLRTAPAPAGGAPRAARSAPPLADAEASSTELPAALAAVAEDFERDFERRVPPPQAARAEPLTVKRVVVQSPAERAAALRDEARTALAAGRAVDAETRLRQALSLEAESRPTLVMLAELLLLTGRLQQADTLLAEALAVDPLAAGLAAMRARLLVEQGRDAEALAVLESIPEASPSAQTLAFRAALMQRLGDHAGARDAYRQVVALEPDNAVWWMGLGISLEALSEHGEARAAYARARAAGGLREDLLGFVEKRLAALGAL